VKLHFEKGNREQNQALISACAQVEDPPETALGEAVVIQKEWGKTWARLYVEKQEGKITENLRGVGR
jgi:hypothetical protein